MQYSTALCAVRVLTHAVTCTELHEEPMSDALLASFTTTLSALQLFTWGHDCAHGQNALVKPKACSEAC
eukprot:3986263-Amphidinium_carterae.1